MITSGMDYPLLTALTACLSSFRLGRSEKAFPSLTDLYFYNSLDYPEGG